MRVRIFFRFVLSLSLSLLLSLASASILTIPSRVYGQGGSFSSSTVNNGGVSASSLGGPTGVAVDASDTVLYIADSTNNRVLFFASGSTTASRVYGQSGSFNTSSATAVSANLLNSPRAVAVSSDGVYIADRSNNRVLFYSGTSTTATRVYGQFGSFVSSTANNGGVSANSLSGPNAVAVDADNNLYIDDFANNRVLFFTSGSTTASRVYGQSGSFTSNSAGVSANSLSSPRSVAVSSDGIYIADSSNNRVLFFNGTNTTAARVYGQVGSFTSSTGNIGGLSANSLSSPFDVAVDASNYVYITDEANNRLLIYSPGNTTASQVIGQTGSFTTNTANKGGLSASSLSAPCRATVSLAGLYLADCSNDRVLFFAFPYSSSAPPFSSSIVPMSSSLSMSSTSSPAASVSGDPQFVGFRGQRYQVHGLPNAVFNLLSSPLMSVNALFSYLSMSSHRDHQYRRHHRLPIGHDEHGQHHHQHHYHTHRAPAPHDTSLYRPHAGTYITKLALLLSCHRSPSSSSSSSPSSSSSSAYSIVSRHSETEFEVESDVFCGCGCPRVVLQAGDVTAGMSITVSVHDDHDHHHDQDQNHDTLRIHNTMTSKLTKITFHSTCLQHLGRDGDLNPDTVIARASVQGRRFFFVGGDVDDGESGVVGVGSHVSFSVVSADNFLNLEQASLSLAHDDDIAAITGLLGDSANPTWTFQPHRATDYQIDDLLQFPNKLR